MQYLDAYFLVGPTASGKTEVAHHLALTNSMDILSADSMLVYTGMDIGTAKPTPVLRAEVRYVGIDIVSPCAPFAVSAYHRNACDALLSLAESGRKAIVVGGTGLYLKSLTHGLSPLAPPDPALRTKVSRMIDERGVPEAVHALTASQPAIVDSIADPSNPRRVLRAVEFAQAGYDSVPNAWKMAGPGAPVAGIKPNREYLRRRVRQRVETMYSNGLVDEVRRLMNGGLEAAPTASKAIGYSETIDYIVGRCTLTEAKERTILRTNQLAKRQLTWFKHQMNVKWIDTDETADLAGIARSVIDMWREHGPTPIRLTP